MSECVNQDQVLECVDCGEEFIFEAGEQAYFQSKELSTPKRCPECRARRRRLLQPDRGVR